MSRLTASLGPMAAHGGRRRSFLPLSAMLRYVLVVVADGFCALLALEWLGPPFCGEHGTTQHAQRCHEHRVRKTVHEGRFPNPQLGAVRRRVARPAVPLDCPSRPPTRRRRPLRRLLWHRPVTAHVPMWFRAS
jgi:hypothetical protein